VKIFSLFTLNITYAFPTTSTIREIKCIEVEKTSQNEDCRKVSCNEEKEDKKPPCAFLPASFSFQCI